MKNREWVSGLLIGVALTVLVLVIYAMNGFEWLELRTYDLRFALRGPRPLSNRVVLVTIDEESLQKLGTTLRGFKRSLLARAIERLTASNARLIGLDMVLSEPSGDATSDRRLREAMAQAGNVILPRFISSEMVIPPLAGFREVEKGEGLINVALDRDGVLRSMPVLSVEVSKEELHPYLTFSLEIARLSIDPGGEQELDLSRPNQLKIGSWAVPIPDNQLLINFYGPPRTFPHLPIWRVVSGEFSSEEVSGRIVLIGSHNPAAYDAYRTPFSGGVQTVMVPWGGQTRLSRPDRMYGVEIHANALQTVLDGTFIHRTSPGTVMIAITLLGLMSMAMMALVGRLLWPTLALGFLTMVIPMTGLILFAGNNLWIDVVPLMVVVVCNYVGGVAYQRYLESRQKKRITGLFGRYVSNQLVERLIQNPSLVSVGGTKQRLTIFFSDIRGFTAMSEQMDPTEVGQLLNEYFGEMTRLIFKNDGTLDKFMGDAILAFFGNPVPYPDHALRAVKMSLEMQEAVDRLNRQWRSEGRKTIMVGIGINTGTVTVGNMGSEEFLDYTVIGDEVNLACRLEENAKGGQILISQNTFDEVKGRIEVKPLEPITVKGKSRSVSVYEVLGLSEKSVNA